MNTTEKFLFVLGLIIIISCLIGIIVLSSERSQKGTLYLIDSDDPICTGTLYANPHAYANVTYRFNCDDGREIKELTNFILK